MKLFKKIFAFLCFFLIITILVVVFIGYQGYQDAVHEISIEKKVAELKQTKNYTSHNEIAKSMKDAIIAIEDRRFFNHSGVDYYAVVRSVVVNIKNEGRQGGSTLTQQLGKNMYFMKDNSGIKKISEAFIARELEYNYTKEEILEFYLNIVYFGDGYYGIYDASMGYFGVHPKDLNIKQASMLAGMPQAPSVYALSNQNEMSYDRQKQVLKSMLDLELITQVEYEEAIK